MYNGNELIYQSNHINSNKGFENVEIILKKNTQNEMCTT